MNPRSRSSRCNGVTWTRRQQGGHSTGTALRQALGRLPKTHDLPRQWNGWQEGRRDQEHDRLREIISEWPIGVPEASEEEAETFAQAEMDPLDESLKADRNAERTSRPGHMTKIVSFCGFACCEPSPTPRYSPTY